MKAITDFSLFRGTIRLKIALFHFSQNIPSLKFCSSNEVKLVPRESTLKPQKHGTSSAEEEK